MSIIMDAWRQRGYAPPGSERMLQDYEDALQLERDKQSLIFALTYLPAETSPPAAPPSSPEYRGQVPAGPYMPSNGPEPVLQPDDPPGGSPGLAGGAQAIRTMPDVGGDAFADKGIRAAAPALDTNDRAETVGSDSRWAAIPATRGNAYLQPDFRADQTLQDSQIPRPAWADHIAGIDTPTLEAILAQRYAIQQRGGGAGVYGSQVSHRIGMDMDSGRIARLDGLQNLSSRDSGRSQYAGVQQAASNKAGNEEAPVARGPANPAATASHGQAFLDGVGETLRASRGSGPTRASLYRDFVVSGEFGKLSVADQRMVLAALDSYANELTEGSMANGVDAKAADAALRYAADQARAAGAIPDRTRFAAEARVGATAAMPWLQPAIRRGQEVVKSTSDGRPSPPAGSRTHSEEGVDASTARAGGETVSLFRKMADSEAQKTIASQRLQPAIKGSDSSKYLSESLDKVQAFDNKAVKVGSKQQILEFLVEKPGYGTMMNSAIPQFGSKGIDAIKFHYEGLSQSPNSSLKNIAIPKSKLDDFNSLIVNVRKVGEN